MHNHSVLRTKSILPPLTPKRQTGKLAAISMAAADPGKGEWRMNRQKCHNAFLIKTLQPVLH
jgi:hypothetical protein